MTVVVPALPLLPLSVVIPVRKLGLAFAPLMVSEPTAFTETLPELPDPKVPLEI